MQVKTNISVALLNDGTNSALASELESYGLSTVSKPNLEQLQEQKLLLYSNSEAPLAESAEGWIWLYPRATLSWIDEQLRAGAKRIIGSVQSDDLSLEFLEGLHVKTWHVHFRLGLTDFDIDAAANILARILELAGFNSEREQKKLRVVALEAITNAWEHGYGCDKSKRIDITYIVDSEGMTILVEHQGKGFSLDDVPDPMAPENLLSESGRGILIMNNTLDRLEYEKDGCRLVGYKNFDTN